MVCSSNECIYSSSRGISSPKYSSSSSISSSAVASWYCWYSETRSFMLDSARRKMNHIVLIPLPKSSHHFSRHILPSVNSISSIPSPVYQCKKAFLLNIAVNCSLTRLKRSWMAVVLPMKVPDILRPTGGMSQSDDLTLLGIHSTK